MTFPRRLFAIIAAVAALSMLPPSAHAQRDTIRVATPPDTGVPPELKPPISARRAFLSSLVFPGYGQSVLGRNRSGAMMLAMEAVSIVMIRNNVVGLREAKRNATDSVLVSYVDAAGNVAVKYQKGGFTRALIKARKSYIEDWAALLVGNHLFSATDALVGALLWDLPAEVAVSGNRTAAQLGLKLRF